ncbi:uncharacterized protein LOC142626388 [Castanea sativa]|uniref:uncharacterized protein LOC142626388 n=1 Tax=Castanea sativa TaxID=21020 RepID=UPI003F649A65
MLDEAPLPTSTSIRDFQHRKAEYVANAVEQALLLLGDMADLKSMKKQEVFLTLKRDLALVVQAAHRAEELVNSSHRQMKEEKGRRITAMDAFNVAKKRTQELNNKLTVADRDKKSAESALEGVERQAESQRK